MSTIILESNSTAYWYKLVHEAEASCETILNEELESYLVFLLMRHIKKPQITSNVMAVDYLESLAANGQVQQDKLRDVGDQCLIFSGFFPKIAEVRMVKVSYFVAIGMSAYHALADTCKIQLCEFYHQLAEKFVNLMDVLAVIRNMNKPAEVLSTLAAAELWADTRSKMALKTVQNRTDAAICLDTSRFKH